MSSPDSRTRKTLTYSTIDGTAYSVMAGVGESYLAAFILAMGLGEVNAGLLTTLPMLVGATIQLISPRVVRAVGSIKKWVIICAALQGLAYAPLVFLALTGKASATIIFLAITLYWAAGQSTGAAWNSWMARVVPINIRTSYFASRGRFAHLGVLTGLFIGATIAEYGKQNNILVTSFALMFCLAILGRLISTYFLTLQYEPEGLLDGTQHVSFKDVIRELALTKEGRLLKYILLVQVAANISGPYFAPYWLKELNLSYHQYMILAAVGFLSRAVILPFIGKFSKRLSASRLLTIGGVLIVPSAVMWMVSANFAYMIGLQVYSGFAWAIFELGMTLSFFEGIREEKRTCILAGFNFASALMVSIGGAIGGKILATLGPDSHAYYTLFFLSTTARFLALAVLLKLWPKRLTIIFEPVLNFFRSAKT